MSVTNEQSLGKYKWEMCVEKFKSVFVPLNSLLVLDIVVCLAIALSSCNLSGDSPNNNTPAETEQNSIISSDDSTQVSYTIERTEKRPAYCLIYIRLQKKISQSRLQSLSDEVKYDQNCNSDKVRIFYLLPETDIGNGAWAKVDYSPSFSLQYLGLSLKEENEAKAQKSKFKILGAWIDNNSGQPGIAQRIRYDSKGRLIMEYYEISDPDREAVMNSELRKRYKEAKRYLKFWNLTLMIIMCYSPMVI
jgi:hypothetical protein